jgi:GNAT superfamily N-acetyltransferase
MIIRTLTADDLADWRAIRLEALKRLPEAFLTTYAEERQKNDADVSAMLDKGGVLGAFSDQDLAAVLSLDPETRTALAHRAWINAVYVRPDWQGSDVAHQLLNAAILKAKARGFVQLELYVASDNPRAIRFYERAGFVLAGRMPRAVRLADRYQDDLHYVLEIDA